MLGWVLLGIGLLIVISLITLKMLNKKQNNQVTRMPNSLDEQTSALQKFGNWCCKHKQ